MTRHILLKGISGLFSGERFLLGRGASLVVGRSRSCDVSVTRTQAYRRIGARILNQSRGFLRMSRRHFEVVFEAGGALRIRDLSTNGIRVDGHRVRESVIALEDLQTRDIEIGFAEGEVMQLSSASEGTVGDTDAPTLQETSTQLFL